MKAGVQQRLEGARSASIGRRRFRAWLSAGKLPARPPFGTGYAGRGPALRCWGTSVALHSGMGRSIVSSEVILVG